MKRALLAPLFLVAACSDVYEPKPGETYHVFDVLITGSIVTQPGSPGLVPSCPAWRDDCDEGGLVHYEYLDGAAFYAHIVFAPGFDPAVDLDDPAAILPYVVSVDVREIRPESHYTYSGETPQLVTARVEAGRLIGRAAAAFRRGCLADDIIEDCGAPDIPYRIDFDLAIDR
jgi:hypothetical protein